MKKKLFGIACAALMAVACQSNSYKINGVAEGFQDGDTLLMGTNFNEGQRDTLIVKDGKFHFEGVADSAEFCIITALNKPVNAAFFREPGTINVTLNANGEPKVGGTKANDAWQKFNEEQAAFSQKMEEMVKPLYTENLDSAQQQAIFDQLTAMQKEMQDKIVKTAEDNIDNTLGFFLLTQLTNNDIMPSEKAIELIEKMPQQFRQREATKELERMLEASKATEIGKQIEDFSMPTPTGDELSVMSEVAKNRVTILDFWASWCGPCRQETPFMISLYEKYHDKGLGIVGISLDQDHDAWVKGIEELGITWPQISDLKYWQSAAAEKFQVRSIPYMVVLDQKGTIINKGLRGEELEAFISEQLK